MSTVWPSLKARQLRRILEASGYTEVADSRRGSHLTLRHPKLKDIRWAFHDKQTVPPMLVKKILLRDAGMSLDEALEVLK
ncbi:hypothetical protein BMR99_03330 [Propionibacterium freudenreichii]|uniref:YcfA family protein n=1 Tax=Propionibacterium freudenreichii TaxID=1744 RepID=A0A2C8BE91_9ACTN|nr:hypothetical protein BMR99_03330 [Propionibacterium freudenreichii]MDK9341386.1 type II toxin-antitoxin system HicA family toxin [Propionibacterium freudenreichii]SCQ72906.1 Hypothetical protein PFR_JS17-1_2090 [Propionibacterium freudenreichii]SCQ79713.1 Hypothetical protein PFR_JS23_1464 [Propionibacterium freudenreichii]SCQ81397.1 Hypothetical protein PFR_JS17-2_2089 [Propionibacterium freudenreichii]